MTDKAPVPAAAKTETKPFPTITLNGDRSGLLQRKCDCGNSAGLAGQCSQCQKRKLLQRWTTDPNEVSEVPPIVHEVLRSPGQPLDSDTRNFMESRLGQNFSQVHSSPLIAKRSESGLAISSPHDRFEQEADRAAASIEQESDALSSAPYDFGQVRLHIGSQAAESARAVGAVAYTVGQHIVFGAGQFSPTTSEGRQLLAHELAHTVQQQAPQQLQRRLVVNPSPMSPDPSTPNYNPAADPARSLTAAQRFATVDHIVQSLCDDFEVNSSGEVQLKLASSGRTRQMLANSSKPIGCCCLSVLTGAANTWTIEISQSLGLSTRESTRRVILQPQGTPLEVGAFTAGGTIGFQGTVPPAGHELCGHAAIMELGAHPDSGVDDRTVTDVHDPTVRIQNLIAAEHGVPASETRGLAASGIHRGESISRLTLSPFPYGGSAVSGLPASEQAKIRFAAEFIRVNNTWVDVIGHSDTGGSSAGKQTVSHQRALNVVAALRAHGVRSTISKNFGVTHITNARRFTRVEGVSDSEPPPPPLQVNQANWRRVEIIMAGFPAGAQNPIPGTPTTVTPHTQNPTVPTLRNDPDPCVRKLIQGAYP